MHNDEIEPQRLSHTELARTYGVSTTSVAWWKRQGCPHHVDGRRIYYYLPEVIEWKIARSRKKSGFKEELAIARAEAELKKMRNSLVELQPLKRAVLEYTGYIRQRAQQVLVHELAPKLVGIENLIEMQAVIEGAIFGFMTEMATTGSQKMGETYREAPMGSTPINHRRRVRPPPAPFSRN